MECRHSISINEMMFVNSIVSTKDSLGVTQQKSPPPSQVQTVSKRNRQENAKMSNKETKTVGSGRASPRGSVANQSSATPARGMDDDSSLVGGLNATQTIISEPQNASTPNPEDINARLIALASDPC